MAGTPFQASLLDAATSVEVGPVASELSRQHLAGGAWVDVRRRWLAGADVLFERLLADVPWRAERRPMYDRTVDVPRLLSFYTAEDALPDPALDRAKRALDEHYAIELGEPFATVGLAFYRDGRDSVAWHGDRLGRGSTHDTMVAILVLGAPRALLLRPRPGGPAAHARGREAGAGGSAAGAGGAADTGPARSAAGAGGSAVGGGQSAADADEAAAGGRRPAADAGGCRPSADAGGALAGGAGRSAAGPGRLAAGAGGAAAAAEGSAADAVSAAGDGDAMAGGGGVLARPGTIRFELGHGDLLVMGGSCQRTWEHAVPKTARPVGPRISVQFRPHNVR